MNELEKTFFANDFFEQLIERFAKSKTADLEIKYFSKKIAFDSWNFNKKELILYYWVDEKKVSLKFDLESLFLFSA